MCAGFGMPLESALPAWFAGLPLQRAAAFTTYGAWAGAELVATATLFVADGVGTLAGAATLPSTAGSEPGRADGPTDARRGRPWAAPG